MSQEYIFVLCNPEESRNVGACCRAMKNMGISCLRIVGKKNDYDENQVKTLALHAFDVWERTIFYDNLFDALKDCSLAAGTTRRKGKKRTNGQLSPRSFLQAVLHRADSEKIAIVFGNERTGLTDEELNCCQMGITIPSHASFGSLNLSHAVQIIAYELFIAANAKNKGSHEGAVSLEELKLPVHTVLNTFAHAGFFKSGSSDHMELFWKNVLARAGLNREESQYLLHIFEKADALISKKI